MKKLALIIINHDNDIEYDNYIYSIMEVNLKSLKYNIIVLKNKECTKQNLLNQLRRLISLVSFNDKLVFYFSGHTIWSPWKKGFKFFDFKAYHVLFGGKQNWLSNNLLMDKLDQIKCKKLLLFDTCCGPLIQLHKEKNSQIITVSNKLGRSKPISVGQHYIPYIAYLFKKMLLSKERYSSFLDFIKNNIHTEDLHIIFSGKKFIF